MAESAGTAVAPRRSLSPKERAMAMIFEAKNQIAAAEAKVLASVVELVSDVACIRKEVTTDEVERVLIQRVAE